MQEGKPSEYKPANTEEVVRQDPLRDFYVRWLHCSAENATALAECLTRARGEEDIQKFLESNPLLLAMHLGGGHGRWVLPKQRLGSEHVTDFVIGERSSIGFEWYAVELESPHAKMFTKKGDPSHALTHAIRQIQDWRAWLQRNQNYAARNRDESGLGLTDIIGDVPGLILIGRRADVPKGTEERRRQMIRDLKIRIQTYDWLLESVRNAAEAIEEINGKNAPKAAQKQDSTKNKLPKVRVRRAPENIPPHLNRLTTGQAVLNVVCNAYEHSLGHDELETQDEVDLVGGFLQAATDWGELGFDDQPGRMVQVGFDLTKSIKELEQAGFFVFGGREVRKLMVDDKASDDWPVAILRVVRKTNPSIIQRDVGDETV